MKEKKKLSLAAQIFIAMVLAILVGLAMQSCAEFANNYIKPFGTIFLNLVKFIVVPIVLFSIMCGIISMSDIRKVGSIGLKTVIYYLCTTAFAVTIGLVGGNLFKGAFPVVATTDLTYDASATTSFMDTLVNIFPSNFFKPMVEANMLQVIVMAVLLGFSIILVGEKNAKVVSAFNDLNDIFMKCMELILKLSPIGVFCLLCPIIASNGAAIIGSLAMVLLSAYICYIFHALLVYSLTVKAMGGMSPAKFFKGMLPAIIFGFSSASSVGTLPINLDCVTKLGAKREVASFVHGRHRHLSGRVRHLHCRLLRHSADPAPDADHRAHCHPGLHRHCRRARRGHGDAGHGADLRGSAGGRHCPGCRC